MPNGGTAYDQWQNKVARQVTAAQNYVAKVERNILRTTIKLTAAMQTASTEYDSIMKSEATKSFIGDIFFGIILDVLPGLKLVATVKHFEAGVRGASLFRAGVRGASIVDDAIKKVDELDQKFSEALSIAKDVRDRLRSPRDNSESREAASEIQKHLNSRNDTAKALFAKQFEFLDKVFDLAETANDLIAARQAALLEPQGTDGDADIIGRITTEFEGVGLAGNEAVGEYAFLSMSDKLLYAMLKNYVANYVVIYIDDTKDMITNQNTQYDSDALALRTRRLSDLPQVRTDSFITGLDEAKRTAIYKRFPNALAPSFDATISYPGVNSYKDLIKYWKPKVVGTSGRILHFA